MSKTTEIFRDSHVRALEKQVIERTLLCDELLAVLKETFDALMNETAGKQDSHWIFGVKLNARAAIAKAEGRAS